MSVKCTRCFTEVQRKDWIKNTLCKKCRLETERKCSECDKQITKRDFAKNHTLCEQCRRPKPFNRGFHPSVEEKKAETEREHLAEIKVTQELKRQNKLTFALAKKEREKAATKDVEIDALKARIEAMEIESANAVKITKYNINAREEEIAELESTVKVLQAENDAIMEERKKAAAKDSEIERLKDKIKNMKANIKREKAAKKKAAEKKTKEIADAKAEKEAAEKKTKEIADAKAEKEAAEKKTKEEAERDSKQIRMKEISKKYTIEHIEEKKREAEGTSKPYGKWNRRNKVLANVGYTTKQEIKLLEWASENEDKL